MGFKRNFFRPRPYFRVQERASEDGQPGRRWATVVLQTALEALMSVAVAETVQEGFGVEEVIERVRAVLRGEMSAEELKPYRVAYGVYQQRTPSRFMMRVRCTAGRILPGQLRLIAALASECGSQRIHLTTRQELQIHDLSLQQVPSLWGALSTAGLSTRGGGGNSVRNILAPVDAGVALDEVFDVTESADALAARFVPEGDFLRLPRKFKIAFSHSSTDTALATVADLGFIAARRGQERGFRVYVAGGQGARPALGKLWADFVPLSEVPRLTQAILGVYHARGERRRRSTARLRFLWETAGEATFRRWVEEALLTTPEEQAGRPLQSPPAPGAAETPWGGSPQGEGAVGDESFEGFRAAHCFPQRAPDRFLVRIALPLGDLRPAQAVELADFLESAGDDVLRLGMDQNLYLRHVPASRLGEVHGFLKRHLPRALAPLPVQLVCCTGADTCQLGICLSRGAATAVLGELQGQGALGAQRPAVRIRISGCPNACSQHWTADLGFFGVIGMKENRPYPAYQVVAGARVGDGVTRFAERLGRISAKHLPRLVSDVVADYRESSQAGEGFAGYCERRGRALLVDLLSDRYARVPAYDEDESHYTDWDSWIPFSPGKRGAGECGASLSA